MNRNKQCRKCHKILWIFEKCNIVNQEVIREFTTNELEIIRNAVRAQSAKELKERIEIVIELQQ